MLGVSCAIGKPCKQMLRYQIVPAGDFGNAALNGSQAAGAVVHFVSAVYTRQPNVILRVRL